MKIGLYSITYLGLWYRGPALTLEDVIDRARAYGYDGVEIDGKRPHGNPLDLPRARCRELRQKARRRGRGDLRRGGQQRFQQPDPGAPGEPAAVRARSDSHDGRSRREDAADVCGMAGRDGVVRGRALHHRAADVAGSAPAGHRRADVGLVPRRAARGRPLGGRRRRDAGAAEPSAGDEQPGRHAADDSRRRLAARQGVPGRAARGQAGRDVDAAGRARRRCAAGPVPFRRRVRAQRRMARSAATCGTRTSR